MILHDTNGIERDQAKRVFIEQQKAAFYVCFITSQLKITFFLCVSFVNEMKMHENGPMRITFLLASHSSIIGTMNRRCKKIQHYHYNEKTDKALF